MAEVASSLPPAICSGMEENDLSDTPISMDATPVFVEQQHSTAAPVIEHLTGPLEIHVDQVTYHLVEEGTRQACDPARAAPANTGAPPAIVEHGSSAADSITEHLIEQGAPTNTDISSALSGREQDTRTNVNVSSALLGREQVAPINADHFQAVVSTEQDGPATMDVSPAPMVTERDALTNMDHSPALLEHGSSATDPVIEHVTEQVEPVTYMLLEQGTRRARSKLCDSNGYTYNIKSQSPRATYWQCTVRPKLNRCRATVVQQGDLFRQGTHTHNHLPKTGAAIAADKIAALVKKEALSDPLKPAPAIVNEVLLAEFGGMPVPASVKPECLARSANRARQFSRRWDATDLSFKMREDDIPNGFLKEEILKHGRRHLIFATEEQLRLLRKAKSWYIDLTFKFCQLPFKQLLTISTFVSAEDDAKHVPLVFALMSGDAKKDYRKVMKKILGLLSTTPSVRQITVVFEQALRDVLHQAFPDAKINGCVFHWKQVVWRTIQELELQNAYKSDVETNSFLRKVMALPFLPQEEIQPMFVRLWVQATTAPLQLFIQYMSTAWIYNTTWPPSTWSAFLTAVRSYKDVEGWHQRLKRCLSGRKQVPFYLLINLLHKEASDLVALQGKPLSEKKLKRIRTKNSSTLQAKFSRHWEEYNTQTKSVAQLLKGCSDVNGIISM